MKMKPNVMETETVWLDQEDESKVKQRQQQQV